MSTATQPKTNCIVPRIGMQHCSLLQVSGQHRKGTHIKRQNLIVHCSHRTQAQLQQSQLPVHTIEVLLISKQQSKCRSPKAHVQPFMAMDKNDTRSQVDRTHAHSFIS